MSVPGAQATAQAWFPVRSRSSPRSPPSDPRGAATHRTNAFAMEVADSELKPLYQWVDEIPLSRPKRNIARDFADGKRRVLALVAPGFGVCGAAA